MASSSEVSSKKTEKNGELRLGACDAGIAEPVTA